MGFTLINLLNANKRSLKKYASLFALTSVILLSVGISYSDAFTYHWEIDETPAGIESATVIQPIEVRIIDQPIKVASHNASIALMRNYSIYLGPDWSLSHAYSLLQTLESIPQDRNRTGYEIQDVEPSIWKISDIYIQGDIETSFENGIKIVTISQHAFSYAEPFLAEIEGIRGRFFSRRLHKAIVRYLSDHGKKVDVINRILGDRYGISVIIPDYQELTGEPANHFQMFTSEELIALTSMFEEFPSGMLKVKGLNYLVRRLRGTANPLIPWAAALANISGGYIEFMDSAFGGGPSDIHLTILHEKAHFLWAYLFDDQLKQDWIELGGWYKNPESKSGWSTDKELEFVSGYAHGVNPNEDMAESISFYIVNPDKLRAHAPDKYEFIQNRIMHGTRYISKIREDLTFQVYNLYPDYVYPGCIVRVNIKVEGQPEEDKHVTIEMELNHESDLDTSVAITSFIYGEKGTRIQFQFVPIGNNGERIVSSHILRANIPISRYMSSGYYEPEGIDLTDGNYNHRYVSRANFGWKLYINNPLEDLEPPIFIKDSAKLSLSQGDEGGRSYQIVTASWKFFDENSGASPGAYAKIFHENRQVYSGIESYGEHSLETNESRVSFKFADYRVGGIYELPSVTIGDIAGNTVDINFGENSEFGEMPKIEIITKNPDTTKPTLDLNRITLKAEPFNSKEPDGKTKVDLYYWVKDDISGYAGGYMRLRDPHGAMHHYYFYDTPNRDHGIYFNGDPTVYKQYQETVVLPAGSIPGIWGLAEIVIADNAGNGLLADFTEILRFEVEDVSIYAKSDVNQDGTVNIQDLVIVANAIGHPGAADGELNADINADGVVDILDLVQVANDIGDGSAAAPAIYSPTAEQVQSWLAQVTAADDGSPDFRRAIRVLENLLRTVLPETTVLLANYPNPFNPETWIPYQLASASDVRIIIYDTKGAIVRTLDLGHQAPGYYTHRNRAAYWDGRNGLGENVASGVYFYQLQAGSVSNLRKMVILK